MKTFKKETIEAILRDMKQLDLSEPFQSLTKTLFKELETGAKTMTSDGLGLWEGPVAAINFSTKQVVKADLQTVPGVYIYNVFDVAGQNAEVSIWIKRKDTRYTSILTIPNPMAENEQNYNWAMKIIGDLAGKVLANRCA